MIAKRSDPHITAALLTVGVAALGRALQLGDGILMPGTIPWLTVGLVACLLAILVPWQRVGNGAGGAGRRLLVAVLVAALGWQVWQVLRRPPFNEVSAGEAWFDTFRIGIAGAALATLATLLAGPRLRHVTFALLLVTMLVLGVSVIRASPQPHIDVFVFQRDASAALVAGSNPYAIDFPDILGPTWYGAGLVEAGRLRFGYPYLPLTLLLATPGHQVGDFRYAELAAMLLSAALIAYARPGVVSFAAAGLLLLAPRGMYVLERGWTEPFIVLVFAATVFCAVRLPRATPWVLGLLLVSKQYMPFIVGTATLLLREPVHWRDAAGLFLKAAVAGAAVTLPFVLWNVEAFWHSAVMLQFRQPFRWDALSYLAWWNDWRRDVPPPPLWIPFAALLAATAIAVWRCRHTPAGFAAAASLVLFAFFAFNKQAFANYYYLVIGATCCAIATSSPSPEPASATSAGVGSASPEE